ncbi:hypothetical protein DDE05_22705, partial [Streptomyces cavourensis]
MTSRQSNEAEKCFHASLLSLGYLRDLVGVSWRELAGQVKVPRTTVEAWLKKGTVPDEVDGVKQVAAVLLAAARHSKEPRAADFVARLDRVDWSAAHRAVQAPAARGAAGRLGQVGHSGRRVCRSARPLRTARYTCGPQVSSVCTPQSQARGVAARSSCCRPTFRVRTMNRYATGC